MTAASERDGPAERKVVRPALADSYEAAFHDTGLRKFLIDLRSHAGASAALARPRLQRAIGVIYRPETERLSHYYHAMLPGQVDYMVHYDTTRAVEPLERSGLWARGEAPETFPSAL